MACVATLKVREAIRDDKSADTFKDLMDGYAGTVVCDALKTHEAALMHPRTIVLDSQFEVDAPDVAWVTDITYVWTEEGWLYLAAILDLFSRRVVGQLTSAY